MSYRIFKKTFGKYFGRRWRQKEGDHQRTQTNTRVARTLD
jgi:hypothetical protein